MPTLPPDPQGLLQRVKDILLRPLPTWQQIDGEDGSPARIYRGYLVYLAAIPALAGFIGYSLIGMSGFGMTIRVPFLHGLISMVVSYALSLAAVYVLALIANVLAPHFQGRQDMGSAFKLIAYSATAGMVAGVFSLIPALGLLSLLGSLYGIYLLYTGIPVLMKAPREKALVYTIMLMTCGFLVMLLLGAVTRVFSPSMHPAALERTGDATITVPDAGFRADAGKLA